MRPARSMGRGGRGVIGECGATGLAARAAVMKYFVIAQTSFAFQDAFVFAMVMIVLSIIPVFLLPNRPLITHPKDGGVPKGVVLVD